MRLYEVGTLIILIIVVSAMIGIASSKLLCLHNPVEELADDMINQQTVIEVDFTHEDKPVESNE